MYNGRRLSWCHDFDAGCGKPAADAFCKTNGFASATQFAVDAHIGDVQPTRSIGSGAVPLHSGYFVQPQNEPRKDRRTDVGEPHFGHGGRATAGPAGTVSPPSPVAAAAPGAGAGASRSRAF